MKKKKGKKNRDVANARRCGKYGRHRFGNPATVCFPCPVESNRNTEKSRRSVAPDLIKKSVVVKCTNLHACARARSRKDRLIMMAGEAGIIIGLPRSDSDRVDSSVNNRFKYRGTVDSSSIRMHSRASGERRGPKKKKKKQN